MFVFSALQRTLNLLCLLGIALFFVSCTPLALHEAQHVVEEAEDLRQQGKMYEDSTRLAQSSATLDWWQLFYADDYARVCYHYGRLLRAKDNPVDAMRAFICATHSHTHDYHILGRVYSNMGTLCHLADDFSLSYEMYKHSAELFLRSGDSLAYNYALNDMAFELAE